MPFEHRKPAPRQESRSSENTTNKSHDTRCRHCRRPLRALASVSRASGPVCWRRARGHYSPLDTRRVQAVAA